MRNLLRTTSAPLSAPRPLEWRSVLLQHERMNRPLRRATLGARTPDEPIYRPRLAPLTSGVLCRDSLTGVAAGLPRRLFARLQQQHAYIRWGRLG